MKRTVRNKPDSLNPSAIKRPSSSAVPAGVTLVEVIVATLVLAVASLGALSYQYHAVRRAKLAQVEITAAQLAQLLIEDWKSHGGEDQYNPLDLNMDFEKTKLDGTYKITFNDFPMQVELRHTDIDIDTAAGVTLREIRIIIRWRRDYADLSPADSDPEFTTTTYVRRDQSGG